MEQLIYTLNEFTLLTQNFFNLIPTDEEANFNANISKLRLLSSQYTAFLQSAITLKHKLVNKFMDYPNISSIYIAALNVLLINLNGQHQQIYRTLKRHEIHKSYNLQKVKNFILQH